MQSCDHCYRNSLQKRLVCIGIRGKSSNIINLMLKPTEKIWHNGSFIAWDDAKIHVLSHVVSYASAVFEGIRCYATPSGPAIFRLREHVRRMLDSAKIYRMENLAFSAAELEEAM